MEELKHECGVALVRLLKPISYYEQKYGTQSYALGKLYLMMEKQHNRGQEGAGIACVNMDAPVGTEYMFREKALGKDAITEIFEGLPQGGGWEGASLTRRHGAGEVCACQPLGHRELHVAKLLLAVDGHGVRLHGVALL